ncbi:potassium/proton antiporter [Clostridia bacterium]|nr:potassium/proton antiporter [Clostridia bacterium]
MLLFWLVVGGVLAVLSIFSSKLLYKFGVPTLLLFLAVGMIVGEEGPFGLRFADADTAKQICTVGLVFILFYGGFGMRWETAKPVALKAGLLATVGVFLTALVTGILASYILETSLINGMLFGAVIASTDAASVFSILRTKKLNLKHGLSPLLEMESGSNDPMSYMLTIILITIAGGEAMSPLTIAKTLFLQFFFAVLMAVLLYKVSIYILKKLELEVDGLYPILVAGLVVICYAATELIGGNGYLAVYILGVALGNARFSHRRSIVHFFDGISWLVQIAIFFTLGLLVAPSTMLSHALPGLLCVFAVVFVARPIAVFAILTPFKVDMKSQILTMWSGLRGVASIVFATFILAAGLPIADEIFNIVFFLCLVSILFQGALIPAFAKKLDLVDNEESVLKTFNDYPDEVEGKLFEIKVGYKHPWNNVRIVDAKIPESILIIMVKRSNSVITPKGSTVLRVGDSVVVTGSDITELKQTLSNLKLNAQET